MVPTIIPTRGPAFPTGQPTGQVPYRTIPFYSCTHMHPLSLAPECTRLFSLLSMISASLASFCLGLDNVISLSLLESLRKLLRIAQSNWTELRKFESLSASLPLLTSLHCNLLYFTVLYCTVLSPQLSHHHSPPVSLPASPLADPAVQQVSTYVCMYVFREPYSTSHIRVHFILTRIC